MYFLLQCIKLIVKLQSFVNEEVQDRSTLPPPRDHMLTNTYINELKEHRALGPGRLLDYFRIIES